MARRSSSPKRSPNQAQIRASGANFGCLLLDDFPVWCARFHNPLLDLSPLIIHRNGKVIAACTVSRGQGVRIGWALSRATSLCPSAGTRPDDAGLQAYVWERVLATLYELIPRVEAAQPGLVFFEPPSRASTSWLTVMAALAKQIREWNGQAAIGSDRATVELAAHIAAKGAIRRVTDAATFLSRVPIERLLDAGVSEPTLERLVWFGFTRVADLRTLGREQISAQFADASHPRDAALLWRFARAGTVNSERHPVQIYQPPPLRIGRIVFEEAATSPAQWEGALCDAVEQAVAQLNGMSAGVLSLELECRRGRRHDSKLLREATSSPKTLARFALQMTESLAQEEDEVQAIEVRLSALVADGAMSTLFDARRYTDVLKRSTPLPLLRALRNLESRHAGVMARWHLRDEYSVLPEERYSLTPLSEIASERIGGGEFR